VRAQFLVRLSLAAVASLGSSAGAVAGAIEGVVTFPTQLVPSMTVYASDLDTSRVHSVHLLRGQVSFTVVVPPGRYLVFSAPNETGAPNIYGAYTQYSLCAPHDIDGKCEDHTLVAVTVTAKAPRAAVTIDDWYLTDDVAGQIDHVSTRQPADERFPHAWYGGGYTVLRVESKKCRTGAERRISANFADVLCGCGTLSPIMR
jgi:hypothetical protein